MRRDYNGLTGSEVLDLFLTTLRERLLKEGRLSYSQVYHNVHLGGEFLLTSYPHEPETESFPISVAVGEAPKVGKKPKVEKVKIDESHSIPDLARERIAEAKTEDVELVTR